MNAVGSCRVRKLGRRRVGAAIATGLALLLIAGDGAAGAAAPGYVAGATDVSDAERQLAERFAPVMMLKEQPEDCSLEGEPYGPTSVDIVLGNPEVALRQVGRSDPVVTWAPTAADLAGLGEGFFLDFPGSSLSPGCIYERDFDKYASGVPPTVYAHVVQQPAEPDLLFLQFWFYWYYNDWNNKHESDWEGITLKFEASSVDEALASEPVAVGFAQHEGGERADWDDARLEREGDRPVVYSSAGSHASYFGSALYLGRAADEGFGCDDTSGPSARLDPEVVTLPDAPSDADDPNAWLSYGGRWGERQGGAFNGPTGPSAKERWLEPAPWFEDLRASSVVIPSGDSQAVSVIDAFCGVVSAGSRTLVSFTISPTRVLVGLALLAAFASFLVRRTEWDVVAATPVAHRRRVGQILRLAGRTFVGGPVPFVCFALAYIPASVIAGIGIEVLRRIPLVGSLLSLAGTASGTSLVIAALIGSVTNLATYTAVNGAMAWYLREAEPGIEGVGAALRITWDRRRELVGAFLRAFLIVFVLLITVVGIPWAIRQTVRYQFIGQAVVVDGCDGRTALRRSAELVRGRWWHTALASATLNGGVAATSLIVALLLLVVTSSLPLWLFSWIVTLTSALVVPLASIAMAYLHGDAVAQRTSAPRAMPVPAS